MKRKLLKGVGIAFVAILALMIVLPFALRGKIDGIIKEKGNEMLNGHFDYDKLSISLFKNFPHASITLDNFWMTGAGTFESDTLVKSGELTVAVNLMSLFGDSYEVKKIEIDDTRINAIVAEDGSVNWDVVKSDSTAVEEETTESSSFNVKLKEFVIDNMDIVYDDRQGQMYASVLGFNANCSGDLGSSKTTLKLKADAASVSCKSGIIPLLSSAKVTANMNIDADLDQQLYTLKENEFSLNAIKAGLDGWVKLADDKTSMDLTLNTNDVDFKEILSLIPAIYAKDFENLTASGTVKLDGSVKGDMVGDSIVPAFNMALKVDNGKFQYPSLPAGVDQININMTAQNPGGSLDLTTVSVNPFSFRMAGNPFSVIASVKTPISDPEFNVEAKGILNLANVEKVYPLENTKLNGTVNADFKVDGRMSYIEKEQYDKVIASGTIALSDMQLAMPDIPTVDIRKSLFTFTPKYLQLSETTVYVGDNDVTLDSKFENYMGYVFKDSTLKGSLNVKSNNMNVNDFMTASTDTVAATTATADESSSIEIPKNIDFSMSVDMKKVLFSTFTFENVVGKLNVKDGKADMSNLSLNTMGGKVVMNGYYSTAAEKTSEFNASMKLSDMSFAQTYKELDMVRQIAPIFENLKGTYSGNMTMNTTLDDQLNPNLNTLQANGTISTKNISLSGVTAIDKIADALGKSELKEMTVKDMSVDFTVKDGRLQTNPFDIKLGNYTMNLSGTTGLDQTIDYSGKIKLPESAGSLANLSTVDLKIGGSFTSPKVTLDTKSMAKQAAASVATTAAQKVASKLGVDSATASNVDSLKTKVKEKATEKAVNLLKSKVLKSSSN
jgi:hypothetical protein